METKTSNLEEYKSQCLVGNLPRNFLTMPSSLTAASESSNAASTSEFRSHLYNPPPDAIQGSSSHQNWLDLDDDNNPYIQLDRRRKQEEADRLAAEKLQAELGEVSVSSKGSTSTSTLRPVKSSPSTAPSLDRRHSSSLKHLSLDNSQHGLLKVTIVQAKLNKSGGFVSLTRMDPYVRLQINNQMFQTKVCTNGDRQPRWDETFQSPIKSSLRKLFVQVLDRKTFSSDAVLTTGEIPLLPSLFAGNTIDNWFPMLGLSSNPTTTEALTAPQQEISSINLVLSYRSSASRNLPMTLPSRRAAGSAEVISAPRRHERTPSTGQPRPVKAMLKEEDVLLLIEMFPSIDPEAIRSVLLETHGNRENAVLLLLEMNVD